MGEPLMLQFEQLKILVVGLITQLIIQMLATAKREAFHSSIRKKQRNAIMSTVRCRLNKECRNEAVRALISTTLQLINKQQLALLFRWSALGEDDALVHIGNLIIEGTLSLEMVDEYEQENTQIFDWLSSNQFYLRLIHILFENNHFQQRHLWGLIKSIVRLVGQARKALAIDTLNCCSLFYQHGLLLLRQIVKNHAPAVELLLQEDVLRNQLLQSFWVLCKSGLDTSVTRSCYQAINYFILATPKQLQIEPSLVRSIVEVGLLRREDHIRCLSLQILTNLLSVVEQVPQPTFIELIPAIMGRWGKERKCVQVEISYLLQAYVRKSGLEVRKYLILEEGALGHLRAIMETAGPEIKTNCMKVLGMLRKMRFQFQFQEGQTGVWYLFSESLGAKMEEYQAEGRIDFSQL